MNIIDLIIDQYFFALPAATAASSIFRSLSLSPRTPVNWMQRQEGARERERESRNNEPSERVRSMSLMERSLIAISAIFSRSSAPMRKRQHTLVHGEEE
jgi:hypothetical protein